MVVFILTSKIFIGVKVDLNLNEIKKKCRRESDYIITLLFTNELSLILTWLLVQTRISPNQVTLASLICGILCGLMFLMGHFILGSFFLFLSHLLDCTDGNLARAKGVFSPIGRWLDSIGDKSADVVIFLCISIHYYYIGDKLCWIVLPLVDGLLLLLYYYIVDIGLSLGISSKKQQLTSFRLKKVHVKWGLMEPVIYGFVILAPMGLIKIHLVGLLGLIFLGFVYQIVKNFRILRDKASTS